MLSVHASSFVQAAVKFIDIIRVIIIKQIYNDVMCTIPVVVGGGAEVVGVQIGSQ